jgi:parvulin-like peptidyl-prolyl isomerase
MKQLLIIGVLFFFAADAWAQPNMAKMRSELENAANPIEYVKRKWKKQYKIDTIGIMKLGEYLGPADSIAYNGKVRKVYGPFPDANVLVQILGKAPNNFYHLSQILLDTSILRMKYADSLAGEIVRKVKSKEASFEDMALQHTMDGNGSSGGDMGWIARGFLNPAVEKELLKRRKGDVFKMRGPGGVYIVKIKGGPKTDTGFALMMRVFL